MTKIQIIKHSPRWVKWHECECLPHGPGKKKGKKKNTVQCPKGIALDYFLIDNNKQLNRVDEVDFV